MSYDSGLSTAIGAGLGLGLGLMIVIVLVGLAIAVFMAVCQWKVYKKLGLNGWECLIPFYSTYALATASGVQKLGIISIVCSVVPFVVSFLDIGIITALASIAAIAGLVIQYVILAYMLEVLGRPKWMVVLAIFVGIVFWPLLAFTD